MLPVFARGRNDCLRVCPRQVIPDMFTILADGKEWAAPWFTIGIGVFLSSLQLFWATKVVKQARKALAPKKTQPAADFAEGVPLV